MKSGTLREHDNAKLSIPDPKTPEKTLRKMAQQANLE